MRLESGTTASDRSCRRPSSKVRETFRDLRAAACPVVGGLRHAREGAGRRRNDCRVEGTAVGRALGARPNDVVARVPGRARGAGSEADSNLVGWCARGPRHRESLAGETEAQGRGLENCGVRKRRPRLVKGER